MTVEELGKFAEKVIRFLITTGIFDKIFQGVIALLKKKYCEAKTAAADDSIAADERETAKNEASNIKLGLIELGQEIASIYGSKRPDGLYVMSDGEVSMPFAVFDWTTDKEPASVKLELWNQIQRSLSNVSEKTTGYYVDTPESNYSYRVYGATMTRENKRENPNKIGDCPSLLDG